MLILVALIPWLWFNYAIPEVSNIITSIIAVSGVLVTAFFTQSRFLKQQDAEDRREDKRLKSEAAGKRSDLHLQQRLLLSERREKVVEKLKSGENFEQPFAINDLFYQIDEWYSLISNQIDALAESGETTEHLRVEGRMRRQELFDLAMKNKNCSSKVVRARARNLKARLGKDRTHPSIKDLDFSQLQLGLDPKENAELIYSISLEGIEFPEGVNLAGSNFRYSDLSNVNFNAAKLNDCNFLQCRLNEADFSNCNGYESQFKGSELLAVNFSNSYFQKSNFEFCNLSAAIFKNGHFESSNFDHADAIGLLAKDAFLGNCSFIQSRVALSDFENSRMIFCNFKESIFVAPNLQGADLSHSSFEKATWSDELSGNMVGTENGKIRTDSKTNWFGANISTFEIKSNRHIVDEECTKEGENTQRNLAEYGDMAELRNVPTVFSIAKSAKVDPSYSVDPKSGSQSSEGRGLDK